MTEGNIAHWKMKEGDTYAAGDVILEIETDKATMDVEAQDEGVLAKILVGDGQKNVAVGELIAVMAEPGDDLATLEMPSKPSQSSTQSNTDTEKKAESPSPTKSSGAKSQESGNTKPKKSPASLTNKDGSDLSPAVQSLLQKHNIDDPHKIPATGPKGRLVKGDVLALVSLIDSSSTNEIAKAYAKRSRLDLSNIKKAPAPAPDVKTTSADAQPVIEKNPVIEIRKEINLAEIILLSEKLRSESGIEVSIEDLGARAAARALKDIPSFGLSEPSRFDQLFEEVATNQAYKVPSGPKALSKQQVSNIELVATDYYEGGAIPLPVNAPQSTLLTIQAAQIAWPESAVVAGGAYDDDFEDILGMTTKALPARHSTSEERTSASQGTMIASLSFQEGMVNPRIASLYLDRVSQYLESPAHILL